MDEGADEDEDGDSTKAEQQVPKAKGKAADTQAETFYATQQNTEDMLAGDQASAITVVEATSAAKHRQAQTSYEPINSPFLQERSTQMVQPSTEEFVPLSAHQIAARQSLAKELPIFSGSPEEWPLFHSIFEGSTKLCGFTNAENLLRLQRCLKGKARELVQSRLLLPANVPSIISTLRMLYGRPEIIIRSLMTKVQNEPAPRADKLDTIISFALAVQNMCATMEAAHLQDHLCNPVLLQEMVDKLPAQIKLNWAMYKRSFSDVNLTTFSTWLFELAETVSDVTLTPSYFIDCKNDKRQVKEKAHILTHAESNAENQNKTENLRKCKVCQGNCSRLENCEKFIAMNLNDKYNILKRYNLCRTCLIPHSNSRCRLNKLCGINGCIFRHNSLLHKYKDNLPGNIEAATTTEQYNCNAHRSSQQSTFFRIVPVVLHSASAKVRTFAFLDEGSSLTLMDSALANELNVAGPKQSLCLKWTGETQRVEADSQVVSVEISSFTNNKRYSLKNIRTVKSLNLPVQTLRVHDLAAKHKHLRGLPLESYEDAAPRILIGLDYWKLGFPMKAREGAEGEPGATKTRLGWVVYGNCKQAGLQQPAYSLHMCACEENDKSLNEMMKDYFSLDSLGVSTLPQVISTEERRATEILESSTFRLNGGFETALLWKYDIIKLPNSFPMALQRFECFRRKLLKSTDLAQNIKIKIENYLEKGYIRKLNDTELNATYEKEWYLPIFVVANINKPGKLRMVWDAAAQVGGISLNSMLSKGPDQLISLPSILWQFRENAVAVSADIREMFHQVKVREADQQVQRFLWNEDITSSDPDVYVMQVLTFGASCSPSCAQFVKNKNAKEFEHTFPEAARAIVKNHYVDDLLISVSTDDEAIKLAKAVKYIHSKGGFEIRNWISNSPKVVCALGGKQKEPHKFNFEMTASPVERVLGMLWCTETDTFTYDLSPKAALYQVLNGNTRPTKRQVLRVMMTIFDPLGLIAHFIVYIKILMQDIWRASLDWDEQINDAQFKKWNTWVTHLKFINKVQIPRCYFNKIHNGEHDDLSLHVFVDASEHAFAAVAYIRVAKEDQAECNIISAKTRVAPLKLASIPRLELEAARLGARLAKGIVEGHTLKFSQQTFWSDSKTVLSWIQSDHRRYRQFVAFRVSEILDLTDMKQWRYVPTKLNVADDATKWSNSPDFTSPGRWYNGPSFLKGPKDLWPQHIIKDETTEELKVHVAHHFKIEKNYIEIERFSSWNKLVRTQAYVHRFIWNLLAKKKCQPKMTGFFGKEEFIKSENFFYRLAQGDEYSSEIATLHANKDAADEKKKYIDKSSQLHKLSPYLDEDGILRIRGRIDAAMCITSRVKRPILLPKNHYITNLIISLYHQRFHHQNNETVINELRQKYSISRMRVALKKVVKACQRCKNQRAVPRPPEMADLPAARLSTYTRPFSYSGLDYFGPMNVTVGRRTEKRWGVLLTCLTTRAVHIEVASSLSTDSCILAIKRFISRRGVPVEIRCDNGTNFHGAERELREFIQHQNSQLAKEFSSSTTKWTFNPPASPHMGGSWERLVQSIKKTLQQILPSRTPTEELLHSMLLEAERTINMRPLTYLPLDDETQEALTPNHFLLGSSNGENQDSILCDDNVLLKKHWLKSQQFANIFWKRWIQEYLPTLTRRTRWYQPAKPIEIGDIVVIVDENNQRNVWPKGKVLNVSTGADGQVRKAVVQTSTGVYERPAVRLAVLDVQRKGKSADLADIPRGSVGERN